jgi:tRNA dimethylallyltransferase
MADTSTGTPADRPSNDPLLVVIVGPTGSGKTALSLEVAERFDGEIVNCDSVAIYREFEIGTAKPSLEERSRAPHHLLDFLDPTQQMTAGEYARQAREVLAYIKSRKKLPIVVGGTGFYLRALLDGLFEGPERNDDLRARLRTIEQRRGADHVHRILQRLDRAAADRIHPNDLPKVIRAIEVCLEARRPMTELWHAGRDPLTGFRILRLGLNPERNALYTRINQRCSQMFDAGLVDETRRLMDKYPDAPPLASLGYQQAAQFLRGEITLMLAVWSAQQGHRNYAKRQLTWFRREPEVKWLPGFGDERDIQQQALAEIENSS